jgi:hypothetical protein
MCLIADAVCVCVLRVPLHGCSRRAIRAVCTHWCDAGKRTITRLRPTQFPVKNVAFCFPSLKSLDLSGCTKVRCRLWLLASRTQFQGAQPFCPYGWGGFLCLGDQPYLYAVYCTSC